MYESKGLNREKIIGIFYTKVLLLSKLELNDAAVVDTSNLAAKYDFIVLKDENNKLDIKK